MGKDELSAEEEGLADVTEVRSYGQLFYPTTELSSIMSVWGQEGMKTDGLRSQVYSRESRRHCDGGMS